MFYTILFVIFVAAISYLLSKYLKAQKPNYSKARVYTTSIVCSALIVGGCAAYLSEPNKNEQQIASKKAPLLTPKQKKQKEEEEKIKKQNEAFDKFQDHIDTLNYACRLETKKNAISRKSVEFSGDKELLDVIHFNEDGLAGSIYVFTETFDAKNAFGVSLTYSYFCQVAESGDKIGILKFMTEPGDKQKFVDAYDIYAKKRDNEAFNKLTPKEKEEARKLAEEIMKHYEAQQKK
jgi:hypothetical protein